MKYSNLLTAALVSCVVVGCSTAPQIDYESAGLVDVSGTVTMDGKPLANAMVFFETPDERFSYGRTDESGHYEMRFDNHAMGVMPGPKTVRISTSMAATEDEASIRQVETVPAKYNKKSELKREVKPNEAQIFDFDLTSEGEVVQPKPELVEK